MVNTSSVPVQSDLDSNFDWQEGNFLCLIFVALGSCDHTPTACPIIWKKLKIDYKIKL